jgi:hypothetical protein
VIAALTGQNRGGVVTKTDSLLQLDTCSCIHDAGGEMLRAGLGAGPLELCQPKIFHRQDSRFQSTYSRPPEPC